MLEDYFDFSDRWTKANSICFTVFCTVWAVVIVLALLNPVHQGAL